MKNIDSETSVLLCIMISLITSAIVLGVIMVLVILLNK